jgi:PKD repeat protein
MRAVSRPRIGRDRRHKSRGQSFVEFAIIAPVLLLLLLITLDFGRLFMSYVTLNNTVRIAANFGALNPGNFGTPPNTTTYDQVVNREVGSLACPIDADGAGNKPPIPTYPTGKGLGDDAVVQMTCQFSPLTPLIGAIVGAPFPISAEARFPVRTGAIANISGSSTLPPPGSPFADFSFTGVTGGTVDGSGNVTGTAPVTVTVLDNSSNAQTYDWDWGDGSTHDFTAAPDPHTYTGTSTYTLTLTVTNSIGSASHSQTVNLGSAPTPPPTPPPALAFYGTPNGTAPQVGGGGITGTAISGSVPSTTVVFTNQTTNANTYSWDFGDGTAADTAANPSHAYTTKGVFDVTLTVTDPTGAAPYTRATYVTIGCVVPTFAGQQTSAAASLWSTAGFTGQITYQPVGAKGVTGRSSSPPNPSKTIASQEAPSGNGNPTGGSWVPPVDPKGNGTWCGSDINLRYNP